MDYQEARRGLTEWVEYVVNNDKMFRENENLAVRTYIGIDVDGKEYEVIIEIKRNTK